MGRPRGRPPKGEEAGSQLSPERINKMASELILKQGYRSMTLADLSEAFGMSKPTLYRYIDSKQDLLFGIIDSSLDQMLEIAQAAVKADLPPAEKMKQVMKRYLEEVTREEMIAIYFDEKRELSPEHLEIVTNKERQFVRSIETIYLQGVSQGVFVAHPPLVVTFAIIGAISWVYRWYDRNGYYTAEEVSEILSDILAKGYLAPTVDARG